jgi:ribosomal protein L37AE/L43A
MAYIKLCPECQSRSIRASKEEWTCPHCGEDLSDEPVFRQIKIKKNWWNETKAEKDQKVLA